MDYAVNRYDNVSLGRFTSPDPLSSSAKEALPYTFNRYAYTANDPVNKKDPTGLDPFVAGEFPSGTGRNCPCEPFGLSLMIDGSEISRELLCIAILIAPYPALA